MNEFSANKGFYVAVLLLILSMGGGAYFAYENFLLKGNKAELEIKLTQTESEFASSTQSLKERIALLEGDLAKTQSDRDDFAQKYTDEKNRVDTIQNKVNDITSVVGTLDKLSKMDPELLQKYSKVYFLNEHYIPSKLADIGPEYIYNGRKDMFIHTDVKPFLEEMLKSARSAGVDLQVISAYRSFGTQAELKSSYTVTYGAGTANQFSADQGYSEHQLGTTVDLTTKSIGASYASFEKTPVYAWLTQNAHTYGFVLSYPPNNAYYKFEPWHWRFVGKSLAGKLHAEKRHFYDLDQRVIDTYLISFFD